MTPASGRHALRGSAGALADRRPRQSSTTSLAKALFGQHKPYVTLENPDEREFGEQDPLRFLQRFPHGAILDEVQRCPALLSWLQGLVDQRGGCRVMGWGEWASAAAPTTAP